jgi:hypothetical protein
MTFVILHLKIRELTCFANLSKHPAYIRETFAGHHARWQPVLNGNGYCQTVTIRSQVAANTCRPRRQCSAVQLVVVVLLGWLLFSLSSWNFLFVHSFASPKLQLFVLFTNKLFLRRRSLRRCCSSYKASSAGRPSVLLQCSWLPLSDSGKIIYRRPPHVTTYLTDRKLFSTIFPIL